MKTEEEAKKLETVLSEKDRIVWHQGLCMLQKLQEEQEEWRSWLKVKYFEKEMTQGKTHNSMEKRIYRVTEATCYVCLVLNLTEMSDTMDNNVALLSQLMNLKYKVRCYYFCGSSHGLREEK